MKTQPTHKVHTATSLAFCSVINEDPAYALHPLRTASAYELHPLSLLCFPLHSAQCIPRLTVLAYALHQPTHASTQIKVDTYAQV